MSFRQSDIRNQERVTRTHLIWRSHMAKLSKSFSSSGRTIAFSSLEPSPHWTKPCVAREGNPPKIPSFWQDCWSIGVTFRGSWGCRCGSHTLTTYPTATHILPTPRIVSERELSRICITIPSQYLFYWSHITMASSQSGVENTCSSTGWLPVSISRRSRL